jgi:hypothetical protein
MLGRVASTGLFITAGGNYVGATAPNRPWPER